MINKNYAKFSFSMLKQRYGPVEDLWKDICSCIPKEKQRFALLDFIHHSVVTNSYIFPDLHSDRRFYLIARDAFNEIRR